MYYKKMGAGLFNDGTFCTSVNPLSIHYIICNVFIIDAGYNRFINMHFH